MKHLPIKISEFLHKVHGDKFPSFGLPPRSGRLNLLQIDQLFGRIEFVGNGKDQTVIVLHGGVMIGHKDSEYEGHQRVYAWSFPH